MKSKPTYTIEVVGSYTITTLAPIAELLSLGYRTDNKGVVVREELNDYDIGELPESLGCVLSEVLNCMQEKKWLVDDVAEWESTADFMVRVSEIIREKIAAGKEA